MNSNSYVNQQSLLSTSTQETRESNDSSTQKAHLYIDNPKWQPIISNTFRLKAYTSNNSTKRTLTFDRTTVPKRKAITLTKIHFQIIKQDSLKSFGFREKTQNKPNQIPQKSTENTTQTKIQNLAPFDTTESKGDSLNILHPNHIRIFYMNINGLELGWCYSFTLWSDCSIEG